MLPTIAQSRETAASQHRKLRGPICCGTASHKLVMPARIQYWHILLQWHWCDCLTSSILRRINKVLLQGKKTEDGK